MVLNLPLAYSLSFFLTNLYLFVLLPALSYSISGSSPFLVFSLLLCLLRATTFPLSLSPVNLNNQDSLVLPIILLIILLAAFVSAPV